MVPPISPDAAGLFAGSVSRRRLLKLAGAGGVALVAGVWIHRTIWRLGTPAPGCVCLTDSELRTAGAVAETFFPGPPASSFSVAQIELAKFADTYIGGHYEDVQHLFKVVLRGLERMPQWGRGGRFSELPLNQRQAVMAELRDSHWRLGLAAYASLRLMFSIGYFEDVRVRNADGLKFGCDLSERLPGLAVP